MSQMVFVIGAVVLLGTAILGINQMLLIKSTTMLDAEASLAASSIAQSMIDEIMRQNYDASTDSGLGKGKGVDRKKIYNPLQFTDPNGLGPNSTESNKVPLPDSANASGVFKSAIYYNDVDDYHNYSRIVKTPVMGRFLITDTVYYVEEEYPDKKSNVQTYHKRIVVTVRHRNMERTVQMADVIVYRRYF